MVLVDTSVWTNHLRDGDKLLEKLLVTGKGIGFVDIHLLASARLGRIKLWIEDKRLKKAAIELGLHYKKK